MNWYAAATCFLGGGLLLAGLIGWHIATGDAFGFFAALVACASTWVAGNFLNEGRVKIYSAAVMVATIATVVSTVAVGV